MRWMKAALLGACLVTGCGSAMSGAPNQPNQQGRYQNSQTAWGDDNQAPQAAWSQPPSQQVPTQDTIQADNQSQAPAQQQVPPAATVIATGPNAPR